MKDFINKNIFPILVGPFIAITGAIFLSAIVILLIGENPLYVYIVLLKGAFGGIRQISGVFLQSTPIIVSGVAACIAFKSGIFNIGIEGQLYVGGFAAAYIGFAYSLPPIIHVLVALLSSMIAGMIWIFLPAYFRAKYNANEVVATIILNYVAILLTSFLTINVFKIPGGWSETPPIKETAYLPRIFEFSRLNIGFFIGIGLIIVLYLYFKNTSMGYECKAVGSNSEYAQYSGIANKKIMFKMMMLSGAIGGLAGGIETLGVHRRFMEGFAPGFGFDGITAALLSNANPIGTVITSIFFGALRSGSLLMEIDTTVSRELVTVIQALIILFISVKISIRAKNRR